MIDEAWIGVPKVEAGACRSNGRFSLQVLNMDPALVLMLSSLLQLQQTLESPTLRTSTSSPLPLLFMTLVTVLGHATALYSGSGEFNQKYL